MDKKQILVVDDEQGIRDIINEYLVLEDFEVIEAIDGVDGLNKFKKHSISLVILDVMLPKMDGWKVCREIRSTSKVPIIMLTARGEEYDKLFGFELGIDDYMVKPFALAELLARVRALLRRDQKLASNQIISGDLMLDLQQKTVTLAGAPVVLTRREFALLRRLVMQAGKLVSRERLQEDIYDWQDDIGSNALEVHIHHLRRKLGTTRIRTVRGEGYCLELQA